jgi:hypothetical protein
VRLLAAILIVAGVLLLTGVVTFLAMSPRLMYLNGGPFSQVMLGARERQKLAPCGGAGNTVAEGRAETLRTQVIS